MGFSIAPKLLFSNIIPDGAGDTYDFNHASISNVDIVNLRKLNFDEAILLASNDVLVNMINIASPGNGVMEVNKSITMPSCFERYFGSGENNLLRLKVSSWIGSFYSQSDNHQEYEIYKNEELIRSYNGSGGKGVENAASFDDDIYIVAGDVIRVHAKAYGSGGHISYIRVDACGSVVRHEIVDIPAISWIVSDVV